MVCTYCGSETYVTNSRLQKRPNRVWRRRRCMACGAIFSTREQIDYEKSWVVQYPAGSKATYSPFLRDKLLISIYKSCQHRPTAMQDAVGLTDTIIAKAHESIINGAIPVQDVAKAAYGVLRRFDQPAAVSYQAFHAERLS